MQLSGLPQASARAQPCSTLLGPALMAQGWVETRLSMRLTCTASPGEAGTNHMLLNKMLLLSIFKKRVLA